MFHMNLMEITNVWFLLMNLISNLQVTLKNGHQHSSHSYGAVWAPVIPSWEKTNTKWIMHRGFKGFSKVWSYERGHAFKDISWKYHESIYIFIYSEFFMCLWLFCYCWEDLSACVKAVYERNRNIWYKWKVIPTSCWSSAAGFAAWLIRSCSGFEKLCDDL